MHQAGLIVLGLALAQPVRDVGDAVEPHVVPGRAAVAGQLAQPAVDLSLEKAARPAPGRRDRSHGAAEPVVLQTSTPSSLREMPHEEELDALFLRCWYSDDVVEGQPLAPGVALRTSSGNEATMKPVPFNYSHAESVASGIQALVDASGDGKILACGQSLAPVLAMRLARPSVLVDINRIPGLGAIERLDASLSLGLWSDTPTWSSSGTHPCSRKRDRGSDTRRSAPGAPLAEASPIPTPPPSGPFSPPRSRSR